MAKTCCFTGHRPQFFPWGNDTQDPRAQKLLKKLKSATETAISQGVDLFYCGGARGVDTWAANIIIQLKKENPNIRLIIAIPFAGFNADVAEKDYLDSLAGADQIIVTSQRIDEESYKIRDRYMVDNSDLVIAVYDERTGLRSGTYQAWKYAQKQKREIIQIRWLDLLR